MAFATLINLINLCTVPLQALHTPAEAANLITNPRTNKPVNAHTLRRWCAAHAEYLSADANPGKNVQRRLTARDVEVLRAVADLRAQGENVETINAQLASMTFAVVVDDDDGDDVKVDTPDVNDASFDVQPAERPQEAPLALLAAHNALQSRMDALERRLDNQAAEARAAQQDRMTLFSWGVVVGLAIAVLLFVAAYLFVQLGPR